MSAAQHVQGHISRKAEGYVRGHFEADFLNSNFPSVIQDIKDYNFQTPKEPRIGGPVVDIYWVRVSMVGEQEIDGSCRLCSVSLTVLTVHLLSESHQLAPVCAADWFEVPAMYYHVYVITRVKDP